MVNTSENSVDLWVNVQPNAKCSELAGKYGEKVKIRLKAPPVDGKANKELIRFVAELFDTKRSAVQILSGERSRDKHLRILGSNALPAPFKSLK